MPTSDQIRSRFLSEFPKSILAENASIFVGAGVSAAAGYPSWKELLREIASELGVDSNDVQDLAALAQWSVSDSGGATRIRQVIRDNIGVDREIPDTLETIARMPIRHIWTTNYDRLVERSLSGIRRPYSVISSPADLSLRVAAGAVHIYKMHGSVDSVADVVISTDDYELFRSKRGAFLPLLQAHMMSLSMLFVGLSFTDPNLRHVLSLIRESFVDAPPVHFAIVRPPHRDEYRSDEEFEARARQHSLWANDLKRYGLLAVEIDQYSEVPSLLSEIERRVAKERVWVSGSWPLEDPPLNKVSFVHKVAEGIGSVVGELGLTLVSGSGLLVSSATVGGFLSSLRATGGWDLQRRLVARPFPQPLGGAVDQDEQWKLLRGELARLSGTVIFVGGMKSDGVNLVESDGVHLERQLAEAQGAFLLPVGATGGAAGAIATQLLGSALASSGPKAQRPTDQELTHLSDGSATPEQLAELVKRILRRVVG